MRLFCNDKEITGQHKEDFVAKLVLSNNLPEDIANLGDHAKVIFSEEFVLDFAFQQARLNQMLTADASEEEIKNWRTVDNWFVDWPLEEQFLEHVQFLVWDTEQQKDVQVDREIFYEKMLDGTI